MPPSTLQAKLDAAWDAITKTVQTALGKPGDRLIPKIGTVKPVPASSRVLVTDIASTPGPPQAPHVTVTVYGGTVIELSHRRYELPVTQDDLDAIAGGDTVGANEVTAAITKWAANAVADDLRAYLEPIVESASNHYVPGPLDAIAVEAASGRFETSNSRTQLLLLAPDGLAPTGDEAGKISAVLQGGKILTIPTVPPVPPIPCLLVIPDALAVVQEAMPLTLGWHHRDATAVLTLDSRRSVLEEKARGDIVAVQITAGNGS